jgi:glycosyltransferase involved in cell wall biosynthesis
MVAPPGKSAPRSADKTLSVVITTLNEDVNIVRAVRSARLLSDDVVVIDSGSTDRTVELAGREGARVLTRPFDDMATQRNFALDHGGLGARWAIFLDADEMVTREFSRALLALLEGPCPPDGVRICRRFHFWGQWVPSGSAFPTFVARVVRVGKVRFRKEGHGEVFAGADTVHDLSEALHDEDLKPIGSWIERQNRYAAMEAAHDLRTLSGPTPDGRLLRQLRARFRQLPGWPALAFAYYMVGRGGLREGPTGWTYCAMKAMYEYFVQLHMRDLRRRSSREARLQENGR